jgi:hypothetical protein
MVLPCIPCIRMICLLGLILAYQSHVQSFVIIRELTNLSPANPPHSSYYTNKIWMNCVVRSEERQPTKKQSPEPKPKLNTIKAISFGEKYKVQKGLHGENWHVRRPRLWQEKTAGILLCFHWNNISMHWTPNTFVRKTKLLTSSGDSMGRGLFALRDFTEGEVIGYYNGKVVGNSDRKDDVALKDYVQGTIHSVLFIFFACRDRSCRLKTRD